MGFAVVTVLALPPFRKDLANPISSLSLRYERVLQFSYEHGTELIQTRERLCCCGAVNGVNLQLRLLGFGDQIGIPQRFDKSRLENLQSLRGSARSNGIRELVDMNIVRDFKKYSSLIRFGVVGGQRNDFGFSIALV